MGFASAVKGSAAGHLILFAVRLFLLPGGFSFCRESFSFCRELFLLAERFFFLP